MNKPEKPLHIVGSTVCIVHDRKALLGLKKVGETAGLWSSLGGRIELQESRFDCAVREVKEECGLIIDPKDLNEWGVREWFRYGMHYFIFYFVCRRFTGEPKNMEPNVFETIEWVPVKAINPLTCTEPIELLEVL